MRAKAERWQWCEGSVETAEDHFELFYGEPSSDASKWVKVAIVGKPRDRTFPVQFLIRETNATNGNILREVCRELDFYLVDLTQDGRDPWSYAVYHSRSMANAYSRVHWGFFPKLRTGNQANPKRSSKVICPNVTPRGRRCQ